MRLLPALTATLLLAVPAPARAADEYAGGCGFDSVAPPGSDTYTGALYAVVVVPRATIMTVTCYVTVNGVEHANTRLTTGGIGLTAGARAIEFTARYDQAVGFCEFVELADQPGVVHGGCVPIEQPTQPPLELDDALEPVVHAIYPLYRFLVDGLDPAACPVLAGAAGTYGGVLTVRPDGDVHVGDEWVWNCPPYDAW